ncbi:hypothetical protein GW7_00180 [Heterocephalus glaber]|uniref:Uncharacterized protein n=1 Tax=Heterocephalus glaber TaxID=10181 RepID=G5BQ50_HETGA|nr:hypothetical protein GW7_00180 [Heterocephalus glaber]
MMSQNRDITTRLCGALFIGTAYTLTPTDKMIPTSRTSFENEEKTSLPRRELDFPNYLTSKMLKLSKDSFLKKYSLVKSY